MSEYRQNKMHTGWAKAKK